MRNISDELKIYELSLLLKEIEYNFANFDNVDFDIDLEYKKALSNVLKTKDLYEYYLELKRFITLFKDGHTGVWFPNEIYESSEYGSKLLIAIDYIDDSYVITNVKTKYKDLIKRFSVIKKINGINIKDYIKEYIYPFIWHEKEDSCAYEVITFLRNGKLNQVNEYTLDYKGYEYSVKLKFTKGENDWVYDEVVLNSEELKEVCSLKSHKISLTDDNIAIITIDTFHNHTLKKDIYDNYELLKQAKAYIVDVRNNSGGNSSNANAVASLFIGPTFRSINAYLPMHIGTYKAWAEFSGINKLSYEEFKERYNNDLFFEKIYKIYNHSYYEHGEEEVQNYDLPGTLNGPLVILCNQYSVSATEDFLNIMKHYTNAQIIGRPTYGSTGQPLLKNLESGGGYSVCTIKNLDFNEQKFLNIGIRPHIEATLSIEDYENRIDSVLNIALDEIRKKLL